MIAIIGFLTALHYTMVIFQWHGRHIEKSYASVLVKIFHFLLHDLSDVQECQDHILRELHNIELRTAKQH
jgi:hypothetical protein